MPNTLDIKALRRALLPRWIRFFSWIFLSFLSVPIVALILALVGLETLELQVFGLSYIGHPLALSALLIEGMLFLMGVVAYGLLWGRAWGIHAGLMFGVMGLVLCAFTMVVGGFETIRLEPLLQVPFIVTLMRLRQPWRDVSVQESGANVSLVIGVVCASCVVGAVLMVL